MCTIFSMYDTHTAYGLKNTQDLKKDKRDTKKNILKKRNDTKYKRSYACYLTQRMQWRSGSHGALRTAWHGFESRIAGAFNF